MHTSAHSPRVFAMPRSRNCRKPIAPLMHPKTNSTVLFRFPGCGHAGLARHAGRRREPAPGTPFAVYETEGVPVTRSLDCAGARCALTELSRAGGSPETVVFE